MLLDQISKVSVRIIFRATNAAENAEYLGLMNLPSIRMSKHVQEERLEICLRNNHFHILVRDVSDYIVDGHDKIFNHGFSLFSELLLLRVQNVLLPFCHLRHNFYEEMQRGIVKGLQPFLKHLLMALPELEHCFLVSFEEGLFVFEIISEQEIAPQDHAPNLIREQFVIKLCVEFGVSLKDVSVSLVKFSGYLQALVLVNDTLSSIRIFWQD